MFITPALLREKKACAVQLAVFAELFPDGVEITEELCVDHADRFDWDWAAENLLGAPAYAEYERVCAATFGRLSKGA